jgi:hypothetical protein
MKKAADGRFIFIWRGPGDTSRLCDAIAEAIPRLCDNGGIAQLDGKGGLEPVNRAALQALISQHLAGARVVKNGAGWQYELYSYDFAPRRHPGAPTLLNPNPGADAAREPDAGVLDEIYRTELVLRLPKVESGAR